MQLLLVDAAAAAAAAAASATWSVGVPPRRSLRRSVQPESERPNESC